MGNFVFLRFDQNLNFRKDGVAAEYIVIEAENLRAQGFNASQVGLDLFQCLFLHKYVFSA